MNESGVVQRYFDAWNRHDPAAILDCFAVDGIYRDPAVPLGITGEAIASYTDRLFKTLPEIQLEIVGSIIPYDRQVVVEWLMHNGPTVSLPGVDMIVVDGGRIQSVQGYFDRQTFSQQIGTDNWSNRVASGKTTMPGAFSLTWIEFGTESVEREQIAQFGQRIGQGLMQTPGVITFLTAGAGRRWFTITAWADVENLRHGIENNQAHKEAMHQFFHGNLGTGLHTSIWIPHHIGPVWVRCSACKQMIDYHRAKGICRCGEPLSPQPSYW